jgi:hypothetical protein
MGKSFIKGLTNFIDKNRQEIRTTLKLSTIMTASIMALIAFHPFILTLLTFAWGFLISLMGNVLSFINAAISQIVFIACTILLALIFSIELFAIILFNTAMTLWAIVSVIADATSIGNQYIAATVKGWITSVTGFLSLPLVEIANKTISTFDYAGTTILLFITSTLLVYKIRRSVIDTRNFYYRDGYSFFDMPILSILFIAHYSIVWIILGVLGSINKANKEHNTIREMNMVSKRSTNDFSESELKRHSDGVIKYNDEIYSKLAAAYIKPTKECVDKAKEKIKNKIASR